MTGQKLRICWINGVLGHLKLESLFVFLRILGRLDRSEVQTLAIFKEFQKGNFDRVISKNKTSKSTSVKSSPQHVDHTIYRLLSFLLLFGSKILKSEIKL